MSPNKNERGNTLQSKTRIWLRCTVTINKQRRLLEVLKNAFKKRKQNVKELEQKLEQGKTYLRGKGRTWYLFLSRCADRAACNGFE